MTDRCRIRGMTISDYVAKIDAARVYDVVRVSMSESCMATQDIFEATRSVCEPSGALALADERCRFMC